MAITLNLYTVGAHARRSWSLYRKALGPRFEVGVISCENEEYDPERWWESSAGLKTVIDETIAWLYSQFFFLTPQGTYVTRSFPKTVSDGTNQEAVRYA
jgi:hypothetical protein